MFGPRGTLPPRPRGPNPAGAKPPAAFGAAGAPGQPRKAAPAAAPQAAPQRCSGQDAQWTGSQRINVRVTLHRADPRKVKEKSGLHQEQKGDPRATRWDGGGAAAAPKAPGPAPVVEQNSNPQNRYTPESASSILASFGLSNEDLEELSRYPDDQLTPENMPRILREIRIRKMGHAVPALHGAGRAEEPPGESGAAAAPVKGKVIDYGHASKYGYTEDPMEICPYNAEAPPEEPLESRVYTAEPAGAESREEFQREPGVPVAVPPPNPVPCAAVFPAEELLKLPAFPAESSAAPAFFPAEPQPQPPPQPPPPQPAKVPVLCAAAAAAAPAVLPVVKPVVSQPPMPPVLPPILPALLPTPLPQPLLPPVLPPLVQPPVSQHVLPAPPLSAPPLTTPPFSAGLLAAISHHEQKQRDTGAPHAGHAAHPAPAAHPGHAAHTTHPGHGTHPNTGTHPGHSAQPGTGGASAGHKPFHKPFRSSAEEPIKSPFGVVKASWLPVFSDPHKSKRLPTPSMMNDYYATSPRIFPHLCSLCNLECTQMKDWIVHQNNPAHLESCRRLRQQYPDWNPEAHSSSRHAERKENRTPRRRCGSSSPGSSSSCSPGRRRCSGTASGDPPRSGGDPHYHHHHHPHHHYHHYHRSSSSSSSSLRRPRSRSRSPGRFRRPRSRSPPRHGRRMSPPPPRHRSRSPPGRPREPPRAPSRARRSSSAERERRSSRAEDRKAALEAVMKTLGPGFLEEFRKHKNLQESLGKATIPTKKPGKSSGKIPKKEGGASEGEGRSPGKEEEPTGKNQPGVNRLLREEVLSCGTVLQLSDLPDDGFTDQDIKKLIQPFGKVSDIILLRSRNEAYLEMNYREAVLAAVKFGETQPVLLNGKRIRISVAEQAKKPVKKKVLNPKKTPSSSKKIPSGTNKSPKALPGKKEKLVKKIPGEKKMKKSPSGEGKALAEDSQNPSEENRDLEPPDPPNSPNSQIPEPENSQNSQNSQNSPNLEPQIPPELEGKGEPQAGDGTDPQESPESSESHDQDEFWLVAVSDLPAQGCSPQTLQGLSRPFGTPRDLLVINNLRKAFLELPRGAAQALLSSHGRSPLSLGGTQVQLQRESRHRDLRDEEAIFLTLIKDSDPKVDISSLRSHLVHLGNLPAEGFRELEVVCAGLRFGKVQHYAVLSDRNTAILQLDSPKSARSMHSFLQQYPYTMGEHTLTCSLSSHADLPQAETGKREVKRDEGTRGSSGLKKIPEGSGTVQKPPGNASGEPRKGQIPTPNAPEEEIPAGTSEIPGSQAAGGGGGGAAARERPSGMDAEGSDPGIGIPADPAGSKAPAAGKGEAGDEAGLEIPKEDEERSASSAEPLESSGKATPAAGETPGAVPGMSPSSGEAPSVSPGVPQPGPEPEKPALGEAGKSSPESKTLPKTPDAPGKNLDAAGAEREGTAEESGLKNGENPGKSLGKAGAELEKTAGKTSPKGGENPGNAAGEIHAGSSVKTPPNKGVGGAVNPAASLKESCLGKTLLKAVVSVPDILKQRIPVRISEPSLGKAGESKIPPKAGLEKKIPPKAAAQAGAGSSQWKGNGNSGADAQQGDNGKSSSQQGKDSQLESKQGESGTGGTRDNPGGNQAPGGGGAAAWKGGGSAGKQKEEEELFPFNLDEFVTVDEVLEDAESPAAPRRNPPRAKRKEPPKANPAETAPKRRRGAGAEGELSFVTLDEIGEEEDAPGPLPGVDPQGLLVVDEVVEEEELAEAVKDPQALLTLDELSEHEEPGGSQGAGPRAEFEERRLKAEPLVTVDEIGEVEELPLNEPAELGAAEEGKANPADCAASHVPDDPNALVTVDEIQEDNEDNPLVTLDEVNEDEDDFLADFNHLKEGLNFVTVDEVGDEEEESALPGKNPPRDEDDEDIVAVAGPEEMGILGDANAEEEVVEISKAKAAQLGTEDAEPKSQQKKTAFPGVPKMQSAPKALDILVPKAGFFCQICSLFYADEPSMINHCRTPLHRQNMEKFMAKQQDNGGEEPSSR